MPRVMITGSREWRDGNVIAEAFTVFERAHSDGTPWVLIHGDARGADRLGAHAARELGWAVLGFPAEWSRYGRAAGTIRNIQMLDESPDFVLAFPTSSSRGTWHAVKEAEKRRIPVTVYNETGSPPWSDTIGRLGY